MTSRVGVAISTTGDPHRLGFLETAAWHWGRALGSGARLFVTVDGDEAAAERVRALLDPHFPGVYRVGQRRWGIDPFDGLLGVATNKNTGIELLMDAGVEHLFLSDDDSWPIYSQSLTKHIELGVPHSMVCWGKSRLAPDVGHRYIEWTWPRGSVMYVTRAVIEKIGGMDERFGPGGHEHVEWSNRIHNAGLTPSPFCSPASYATRNAMGAAALWHCEDMRRPGEKVGDHMLRRKTLTSVRRKTSDWEHIEKIMRSREGSSEFVGYRAHENSRWSATLCQNTPNDEACAVEPATPRSEK